MDYDENIIEWCIDQAENMHGCKVERSGFDIDFVKFLDYDLLLYEDMLKSKKYMKMLFLLAIQWINAIHKKISIDLYDNEENETEQYIGIYVCDRLFEKPNTLYEALEFVYKYPKLRNIKAPH